MAWSRLSLAASAKRSRQQQCLGASEKVECNQIVSRLLFDCGLFTRSNFRLKLVSDCLGDLALDRKNVIQRAVVLFSPLMQVGSRINQLRSNPHPFANTLHRPFKICVTPSCRPISRRLRGVPVLYCITLVRLITFRSAIQARLVKTSS